jgi:hypothetical protein
MSEPTASTLAALDALEAALDLARRAANTQTATRILGGNMPPHLYRLCLEFAVALEDEAREAANAARLMLGGEVVADPAEPSPVRPDA